MGVGPPGPTTAKILGTQKQNDRSWLGRSSGAIVVKLKFRKLKTDLKDHSTGVRLSAARTLGIDQKCAAIVV
jgi:hypothetical protein